MKKFSAQMLCFLIAGGCLAAPPTGYRIKTIGTNPVFGTGNQIKHITINNRGSIAYDLGGARFWSESTGLIVLPQAPVSGQRFFSDKALNDNDVMGGMIYQGELFTGPRGLGYTWSPTDGYRTYIQSTNGSDWPTTITAVAVDGTAVGGYALNTSSVSGSNGYWSLANPTQWVPLASSGQAKINNNNWIGSNGNRIFRLGTTESIVLGGVLDPGLTVQSISDANLVYSTKQLNEDFDRQLTVHNTAGQVLYSSSSGLEESLYFMDSIARDQMTLAIGTTWATGGLETTLSSTFLWNHISGGIPISSLANDSSFGQFTAFELNSINENYQIAGKARDLNGGWYVVMLDPVPEPASILVLTAGLAGLLRRKKQKSGS